MVQVVKMHVYIAQKFQKNGCGWQIVGYRIIIFEAIICFLGYMWIYYDVNMRWRKSEVDKKEV